jgi:hypothetical protein
VGGGRIDSLESLAIRVKREYITLDLPIERGIGSHYVHLATSRADILSKSFSSLDKMNLRSLRRGDYRARTNNSENVACRR